MGYSEVGHLVMVLILGRRTRILNEFHDVELCKLPAINIAETLVARGILLMVAMRGNVLRLCWRNAVVASAVLEHGSSAHGVRSQIGDY